MTVEEKSSKKYDLVEVLEWDIASWQPAVEFWRKTIQEKGIEAKNKYGLEIGSRNGGLSLFAAKEYGIRMNCSDLNGPTENAKNKHAEYGLLDRVEYSEANACDLPFESDSFDFVFFKSMVGALGKSETLAPQKKAIQEIHRVLKKGGHLFFAENMTSTPLHTFARNKFISWSKHWQYVPFHEMKKMLSIFDENDLKSYGFSACFGRSENMYAFLAQLDKTIHPIVPQKYCYVGYGFARK